MQTGGYRAAAAAALCRRRGGGKMFTGRMPACCPVAGA